MLYRAYDLKAETDGNFADVEQGSYWYEAIAVAKALGIAKGYGDDFKPYETITRQDAMTLIYRTLELKGITLTDKDTLASFPDASNVSSYANDAVSALVAAGIINGKNGNLAPKDNMTRAEMAVALYKAVTKLG
jgi:endo-1,4-beta-xylanase